MFLISEVPLYVQENGTLVESGVCQPVTVASRQPFRVGSCRLYQLPSFVPQVAGFRRAAVHIEHLKKAIWSYCEGWWSRGRELPRARFFAKDSGRFSCSHRTHRCQYHVPNVSGIECCSGWVGGFDSWIPGLDRRG